MLKGVLLDRSDLEAGRHYQSEDYRRDLERYFKAQDREQWEFKPGLNLFFGKNGSGKSSLLRLLARLTYCYGDSYVRRVKHDALQAKSQLSEDFESVPCYFSLFWDKNPGMEDGYFSENADLGRAIQGIQARQCSAGQIFQGRIAEMCSYVEANPSCVLFLDEPETHLEPELQIRFWEWLAKVPRQVFCATQSVFALQVASEATVWEFSPEARDGLELPLAELMLRLYPSYFKGDPK